jgi:peroxisomal enoyl-CoA hydratase 2
MSGASSVDAIKGAGAGYEYPTEEVSWLKRDVLLFANSIGCTADELHFLYVWKELPPTNVPPTNSLLRRSCTQTLLSFLPTLSSCVSTNVTYAHLDSYVRTTR